MRRLLILLAGVLVALPVAAQDVLLLRDAQEIRGRVEEIGERSVVYRRQGDESGPLRRIGKDKLVSITYANGEREFFVEADGADGAADYPWPAVSRTYAVGDLFEEGDVSGIVVQTTDGGRHGVIVSLETRKLPWVDCTALSGRGMDKTEVGCDDADDGWRNMQRVEAFVRTHKLTWSVFPAFGWCRMLGPGWYLPAVNEFRCLSAFAENGEYPQKPIGIYRMCRELYRQCQRYGETPKGPFMTFLASSTESSAESVWHIRPDREKGNSSSDTHPKLVQMHVKAFHRF